MTPEQFSMPGAGLSARVTPMMVATSVAMEKYFILDELSSSISHSMVHET
jgi:hypothetical protein